MSDWDLIANLVGPSLAAEEDRSELLAVYGTRTLALGREPGYRYLHSERERFLARLATPRERVEFLLSGWLAADREEWRDWSILIPSTGQVEECMGAQCARVAAMILESASALSNRSEIANDQELLELLAPGLQKLDDEEVEALEVAAKAALEGDWWGSDADLELQLARQALVRNLEESVPQTSVALREERDADAVWPLDEEVVIDAVILRGWREMAPGLGAETIERLLEAVPEVAKDEQPLLFAEGVGTQMVLRREGNYGRGPSVMRTYSSEITEVRTLGGDYYSQARIASEAAVWMRPSAKQMVWLLRYIGNGPNGDTKRAVREWTSGAGRGPTGTLVKELMGLWIAKDWMSVLRDCDFEWAPVLKRATAVLLASDNHKNDRLKVARALCDLGPHTKNGPEQVARLAAELLDPKRKGHRRNDLAAALALCESLISSEREFGGLEKTLIAYSKRHGCRYTPDQNRSILMAGIVLPEERLSPKARSGLGGAIDEVRGLAGELGRAVSALNPLSGGRD